MAQNPVAPIKRRARDIQGMKNVKKKLNDLMILCETDGFLIYSSGDKIWSAPEELDGLIPLFKRYDDCIRKGFHKPSFFVNPLPEANTNLVVKETIRKQGHNSMSDAKLKSNASKAQVDEDYLLALLNSFTDDKNFDSLSVEQLYEMYNEIDSQVRTIQANLKPLDFFGNFAKCKKYQKEVESVQNGMSHVTSFKQEHQLPYPRGNVFYHAMGNGVNKKENPHSVAVGENGRSMVDYPLVQSPNDNFSFVLKGKEFEYVEVRCNLSQGAYEEHQYEDVDCGTRNTDQNTKGEISYSERKQRTGMTLVRSNAISNTQNGEKIDQISHLKNDLDEFHLLLAGGHVDSLELIGKLSTKVDNGRIQEKTSEDEWLDLKL